MSDRTPSPWWVQSSAWPDLAPSTASPTGSQSAKTLVKRHAPEKISMASIDRRPATTDEPKAAEAAMHAQRKALNPSVDRTTAIIHDPDSSKLTITINQPPPQSAIELEYRKVVDWSSQRSIDALNQWRRRHFRCWLGNLPPKKNKKSHILRPYIHFREEEKAWVLRQGAAKGPLKWSQIADLFNAHFEGKMLEGCPYPRPGRKAYHMSRLYSKLLRLRGETEDPEDEEDDVAEESDIEEGEIVEDPRMQRPEKDNSEANGDETLEHPQINGWICVRPWEL